MTPEEKLRIRAATVFKHLFNEPWKHDVYPGKEKYECGKCDKTWPFKGNDPCVLSERKCTVPDPLPLTWDNAKQIIAEVDSELFMAELKSVWKKSESEDSFATWAIYAGSAILILAACNAAERKSNDK